MKTKPTQHSVKELRSIGIQPDVLLCRCEQPIPAGEKRKIALFCNVRESAVIQAMDAKTIMACRWTITARGSTPRCWLFGLSDAPPPDLSRCRPSPTPLANPTATSRSPWSASTRCSRTPTKSLIEALVHGGVAHNVAVNIDWVESEQLESDPEPPLSASATPTGCWCPALSGSVAPTA